MQGELEYADCRRAIKQLLQVESLQIAYKQVVMVLQLSHREEAIAQDNAKNIARLEQPRLSGRGRMSRLMNNKNKYPDFYIGPLARLTVT